MTPESGEEKAGQGQEAARNPSLPFIEAYSQRKRLPKNMTDGSKI